VFEDDEPAAFVADDFFREAVAEKFIAVGCDAVENQFRDFVPSDSGRG